jgi:hypothetical protein
MNVILFILIVLLLAVGWFFFELWKAPLGYEDRDGFHYLPDNKLSKPKAKKYLNK